MIFVLFALISFLLTITCMTSVPVMVCEGGVSVASTCAVMLLASRAVLENWECILRQ